jgi:hypothetical protein
MSNSLLRDLHSRRFWFKLAARTFAGIGFLAVLFGIYDVIRPNAISQIKFPVELVVIALALIFGLWRAWPRPVEETYSSPSTQIRLVPGDLFDRQDNLVIGMADTFDTAIPHIIQRQSIQGQFLEKAYAGDRAALDGDLAAALAGFTPSGTIEKDGKQITYPVGTVAVIRRARQHFFCVAYSEMNERHQAQATVDGFWRSLMNLWASVRQHANGEPVAIPVIGGGQSRLSQILPAQDAIRFIALSFMLASRHTKVCDRLDIVVRPADVDKVDMLEIQAFLSSLKGSR